MHSNAGKPSRFLNSISNTTFCKKRDKATRSINFLQQKSLGGLAGITFIISTNSYFKNKYNKALEVELKFYSGQLNSDAKMS